MGGWVVEITGLREILNALQEVDKKAAKRITDAIARAAKNVVAEASYLTPYDNALTNWGQWYFSRDGRNISYSGQAASAGFKVRRSNFKRKGVSAGAGWEVYQSDPGGNIYEVIGDGTRVGETAFNWQGAGFVREVTARRGAKRLPRSLYPAYYAGVPDDLAEQISDQILDEARKAGLV